jgi:ADP-heptose:LPS heptosyltransferase
MYRVIQIDGGLGRVICAEPAISTYCANNPDTRVVTSFPDVFTNNPTVKYLYGMHRNGLFDDVIKQGDFIAPEPYQCKEYYSQQHHLVQSFNKLVNNSNEMIQPKIFLTEQETNSAKKLIETLRKNSGKKVIAFHPFGSMAKVENGKMTDESNRSLDLNVVTSIVDALKDRFIFLNCSHVPANTDNLVSLNLNTREYMAAISQCDGYISVDSATHHIANSFNIPGVTIFGSTFPANLEYDSKKTFIKTGFPRSYPTNRMPGSIDKNHEAMLFNHLMIKVTENLNNK